MPVKNFMHTCFERIDHFGRAVDCNAFFVGSNQQCIDPWWLAFSATKASMAVIKSADSFDLLQPFTIWYVSEPDWLVVWFTHIGTIRHKSAWNVRIRAKKRDFQQILARVSLLQASAMDHWDQAGVTNLFQINSVDESYRYVLAFLITISTRKYRAILTFLVVMIIKSQCIYN